MKITIGGVIDGSEDVRFLITLPDGFSKYKPDFLKMYFDSVLFGAVSDLRVPERLPFVKKLNDSLWTLKYEVLSLIERGGDVERLEDIMEEVDLDFIEPKGKSVDEWMKRQGGAL